MTTLLYWFLCAICSYCIGKSYLENLFKPYGGLVSVSRKVWLTDPENTDEDEFLLRETPDNVIGAILWTLLLVVNLVLWPIALCVIVWCKIFPLDTTELEEFK